MPIASKTLAAWVSKCSMVSNSISMLERIASGSPPSTRDCRPFFRNSSFSASTADSSPSNPCLRAMLLHSTIFSIMAAGFIAGGLETPHNELPRTQEGGHRRLHQAGSHRPHDDDDERRAADQGAGTAAFQDRTADDRYQRKS